MQRWLNHVARSFRLGWSAVRIRPSLRVVTMSEEEALQGGRDPALQTRVEACLQDWEKSVDRRHPLRWVPIDLIAQAVLMETGRDPTDSDIALALQRLLVRNAPAMAKLKPAPPTPPLSLPADVDPVDP